MKDKKKLAGVLYDLYQTISKKVLDKKDAGGLIKIPMERIAVIDFKYSHSHREIFFRYDYANPANYFLYRWSTEQYVDFMDNEIKVSAEFENAAVCVYEYFGGSEYHPNAAQSSIVLEFVRILMMQIPNEQLSRENAHNLIDLFIDDCERTHNDYEFKYFVRAHLSAIHFESDQICIGNYLLRKPLSSEFVLYRQPQAIVNEIDHFTQKSLNATTVIEFDVFAKRQSIGFYNDIIRQELETSIDILRLFKIGNISTIHLTVSPESILEYSHSDKMDDPFEKTWQDKANPSDVSKYDYEIYNSEETLLSEFFQQMFPLLKNHSSKNLLSGSYIELALQRYKESLLRSPLNVNRLVSAITCLEALLSNTNSELTFKISIHVAGLLRHLGFNAARVYKKMKLAYNVRSTLVHGSRLKDKLIDFANSHTHEIVNYARLCLIICLQLHGKCSKDNLIEKIDLSLIDTAAFYELNNIIKENIAIPILYQFPFLKGDDLFDTINADL